MSKEYWDEYEASTGAESTEYPDVLYDEHGYERMPFSNEYTQWLGEQLTIARMAALTFREEIKNYHAMIGTTPDKEGLILPWMTQE